MFLLRIEGIAVEGGDFWAFQIWGLVTNNNDALLGFVSISLKNVQLLYNNNNKILLWLRLLDIKGAAAITLTKHRHSGQTTELIAISHRALSITTVLRPEEFLIVR